MSDIFVSYKTTDKERVRALVELLEAQGLNVWWDRNIPPGKTFDQVIEEAINSASCLVVVWSAAWPPIGSRPRPPRGRAGESWCRS